MLPINTPKRKPRLTVNTGSMFSGKSSELLRQGKRHLIAGDKVVYLKPALDSRYSKDEIVTHDGQAVKATVISTDATLSEAEYLAISQAQIVLVDEVQFFTEGIIGLIKAVLKEGKSVYCSGLDMDFNAEPFETVMRLMAIADQVQKFNAVCDLCGDDGYVSAKIAGGKNRLELGSADKYKPLCRTCYSHMEANEIIENKGDK